MHSSNMDEFIVKRRGLFFNNLILLGLRPTDFESKHGIPFHKDMFNVPNKKGYEIVTHFLFSKLTDATGKDYNLPWPLLSKDLERRFKETCYSHLLNFSQENEVRFPQIVLSLLSTFGGDRFYEVYLAFSSYVLKKVIQKNKNVYLLSRPTVTEDNVNNAKQILQLATIRSRNAFVATEEVTLSHDNIAKKYAKNLSECLQKLKQLLKTNSEELKRMKKAVSEVYSTNPEDMDIESLIEKCIQLWKPAKRQRQSLEQFFLTEKKLWESIGLDDGNGASIQVLNGQDIDLEMGENVSKKSHLKRSELEFSSCKQDGKLSVPRFLRFFMAHLKSIIEILNAANLQDFHQTLPENQVSHIELELQSIKTFNKKLSEDVIPKLEESLKKLEFSVEDPGEIFESGALLCVESYNPEAVKERKTLLCPDFEERLRLSFSEEISNGSSAFLSASGNVFDENSRNSNLADSNQAISYSSDYCSGNNDSGVVSLIQILSMEKENDSEINSNAPNENSQSSTSLGDLDLKGSTPDPVPLWGEESWLQEESLNTVTLPDASFDDCI